MSEEIRTTSSTGGETEVRWRAPRPSRDVNPADVAWLAGLFEGEGSFYLKNASTYPSVVAQIAMSDEDVIRRAREIAGVGTIAVKKPGPRSVKVQHQWRVSAQAEVAWLMDLLYNQLGQRRRAKIIEMRGYLPAWTQEAS